MATFSMHLGKRIGDARSGLALTGISVHEYGYRTRSLLLRHSIPPPEGNMDTRY
jgi:hypothetical protein